MTTKKPYCKKRNEILPIGKNMPEDYCVDCEYFDAGDCFAADLPTKYVGDIIHIVKPTAKILKFEKKERKRIVETFTLLDYYKLIKTPQQN